MGGAVKAATFCDDLDGVGGGLEEVFSLAQAVLQQVLVRGAAEVALECADEVRGTEAAEIGEGIEVNFCRVVLADVV